MHKRSSNRGPLGLALTVLLGAGLGACSPAPEAGKDSAAATVSTPAAAQPAQRTAFRAGLNPERDSQAARAVADLPQLVSAENFDRLGFRSVDEARLAAADAPVAVYMVRLDQLRAFQPAQDPRELLMDLQTAVYPVRVGGEVRGVLELHRQGDAWRPRSIGNPAHGRILDGVRGRVAAAHRVAAESFIEVRIPALNAYFLGHEGKGDLLLTPMLDDEALGLKAGQALPAAELFQLLQPRALQHDGQPT